jgi:glutamyl-tRNA reductase
VLLPPNTDENIEIFLIGISYRTLTIEYREKIALEFNFDSIKTLSKAESLVVVNTCNRFEIITTERAVCDKIIFTLTNEIKALGLKGDEVYLYSHEEALKHLFRVTGSLDSMIVGESQIVNQVKEAYAQAKDAKTLNKILHRLFQFAFALAKQIRETGLGSQGLSVSYIAVKLAEQIFNNLADHTVLLIGSGLMSELALLNLKSKGCKNFIIANRTYENAKELADKFSGRAAKLEEIPELLAKADLVIGSAALDYPIITKKVLQSRRRPEPIFLIDLGVPRNFSAQVKELPNVYLYDLDDLGNFIKKNQEERFSAAAEAELYVDYAVNKFKNWYKKQSYLKSEIKIRSDIVQLCEKSCENLLRDKSLNIDEKLRKELAYKLSSALGEYVINLVSATDREIES